MAAVVLPPPGVDVEMGAVAVATGWGQIDPDDTTLPDILQVNLDQCPSDFLIYYFKKYLIQQFFLLSSKNYVVKFVVNIFHFFLLQ